MRINNTCANVHPTSAAMQKDCRGVSPNHPPAEYAKAADGVSSEDCGKPSGKASGIASDNRTDAGNHKSDAGRTQAACIEMESLFIHHLLKEMRAAIPRSGLMDGGRAEEMYTDMMHQQLSRNLAAVGGIGLSDLLVGQLADGYGLKPDEESKK